MTLRRKLLIVFAGLAALSLLVAGVSLWATLRWQATAAQVEVHYQRSLLLQRVRASTFQALKEVEDGLTGDHLDARGDFERALQPAAQDFADWTALADTPGERAEVRAVRAAYDRLIGEGRGVFEMLEAGRDADAVQRVDDELDTNDLERFRLLTEQGVQADRRRRGAVQADIDQVRRTTQVLLMIAALSTISLVLLFAAYLSQDLFKPLRGIEEALRALGAGDLKRRLDADRSDEFGRVGEAFNAAADRLEARLQAPAREVGLAVNLDLARTDARALVYAVLERHREAIIARGVSLEVKLDPNVTELLLDRLKVREVLAEIVENALAALPEAGGLLGLRLRADEDGRTLLEVADDGVGMEPDLIERAVGRDPFEDGGDTHVGLALARAVMEQHGGELNIFSEAGRGTAVQLVFPPRP